MDQAIAAVKAGASVREAARKFDVPRTTLQRRLKTADVKVEAKEVEVATAGHKRRAPEMTPRVSKGPHKAINNKIRMLFTAAGNAIEEKSNAMRSAGEDVYKLGLGQSPFPVPEAHADRRDYLPVAGLVELREDVASWASSSLDLDLDKDDVLIGPGTKELLYVLQTVYYGDLLVPNPSCSSYGPQATIAGRNLIWLPTYMKDRWILRPDVLESYCRSDPDAPRMLMLNSPSNPTGCACTESELEALADVARRYRVLVISDEIYSELHHSTKHVSISRYYPEGTIVSGGLSKWCGAGGWRVGFWLFPKTLDWLRSSMLVMASETYTSVAAPIQYAARRAYAPGCDELQTYKRRCCKILEIVAQWCVYQLRKVDLEVHAPDGGFYVFPTFARHRQHLSKEGILTDEQLCERLLEETGVAVLPGSSFGCDPRDLHVRVAFVDFKGELAMYLVDSMDSITMDERDRFVSSVCPKLDGAMRRLTTWLTSLRTRH